MSGYIEVEKQCFFDQCRELARFNINFRGQVVKVCSIHDQRYGSSYEQGSKRAKR